MKSKPKSILLSGPCLSSYVLAGVLLAILYRLHGQLTVVNVIFAATPVLVVFVFLKIPSVLEAFFGVSAAMNGVHEDEAPKVIVAKG